MNTLFDMKPGSSDERSNEWYTPPEYVEAAREVMGGEIHLDPASCEVANHTVKAARFYTKEDDGLQHAWLAETLWINPPYGKHQGRANAQRSTIRLWVEKLLMHYQTGEVAQAVLLVPAQISARWFQHLWEYPICFVDHNIRFRLAVSPAARPGRTTDSHIYGSACVYFGPQVQKFIPAFRKFGPVITPLGVYRTDQQAVQPAFLELEAASCIQQR
jgi:ParB family chromosome partitioning protein